MQSDITTGRAYLQVHFIDVKEPLRKYFREEKIHLDCISSNLQVLT